MIETRKTIGGTGISAVLGLNQYTTPFDLWLQITGQAEPITENEPMRWGIVLEEPIAKEFERRNQPLHVQTAPKLTHDKYDFLTGSPDRYIFKDNDIDSGLEVKTAGLRSIEKWGEQGTDQIPEEYLLQCQWYMGLSKIPDWHLAALIGGQEYRQYKLKFDSELFGLCVDSACRFWKDFVEANKPPQISFSSSAKAYLKRIYPQDIKPLKIIETETDRLIINNFKEMYLLEDRSSQELENARIALLNLIGDSGGVVGDFGKITYKKSKDSERIDWEHIAKELNPSPELLSKYTTAKRGSRVLKPIFKI